MRQTVLENDLVYHIYTKSIAGFRIFNNEMEFCRALQIIRYYRVCGLKQRFSWNFSNAEDDQRKREEAIEQAISGKDKIIGIIAYCIMPTHLHLILRQVKENGISIFMKNILNSYTRYFNTKYKRKGPLWEARFKRVLIETDEQLLHLTRYIHLNPATAYLIDKPEEWKYSSYNEFIGKIENSGKLCDYEGLLEIIPNIYRNFTEENINNQRILAKIKRLALDQYHTS